MTSLKTRLALELLNKRSQRKGLSKGFTLVELMIVIVIVGVLSAVALPSFLGQQNKAKLTEATSKVSAILKSAHADYQMSSDEDDAVNGALLASAQSNAAGRFFYGIYDPAGAAQLAADNDDNALILTQDANNEIILIVGADPQGGTQGGAAVTPPGIDQALVNAATANPPTAGRVYGCINLNTGQIDVDNVFKDTVDANVNGAETLTQSGLDCSTV